MYIKSAEFVNFCQHQRRQVTFARGLTGIVGPNGSGKTNLMRGIYACLTNDFTRFPGIKQDNVNQLSPANSESFVRVIVHDGVHDAELSRSLRPVKRMLAVNGTVLRKDQDIAGVVEGWFGLPPKIVGDYLFVDQGCLTDFIDDQPAERAKAIQRLFRLDHAETCYEALSDYLNRTSASVSLAIDENTVAARLAENERRHKEIKEQARSLPKFKQLNEDIKSHRALIAANQRRQSIQANRRAWTSELAVKQSELQTVNNEQIEIINDLELIKAETIEARIAETTRLLNDHERCDKAVEDRERLVSAYKQLTSAVQQRAKQVKSDWTGQDDDKLANAASELAGLTKFLATFANGPAECPTCQTPTSALADRIESFTVRKIELELELEKLRNRRNQHEAALLAKEFIAGAGPHLETAEKRIVELDKIIAGRPSEPYQLLKSNAESLIQDAKLATKLKQELQELKLKQSNLQGLATALQRQIQQNDEELSQIKTSDNETAQAELRLVELEHERQRKESWLIERRLLYRRIVDDKATLAKALAEQAQNKRSQSFKECVESVRNVLHRSALPTLVAQSNLELLEGVVNKHLDELGVDFKINVDSGLAFRAVFADGRNVPAVRLSFGEKLVLAIAWRLAVNSEFASEVSILCLDEPTAYLDSDRLDCLRRALERLRFMASSKGLQCIIITHERSLSPLFDHVIDLGRSHENS